MYCPHCGAMLEEEGFFCPFCGESLQEEQTPDMTQNFQEPFRPLPKAQWMIGRSRTCDFVIPAIRVSRQHCLLTRMPDGLFIIEDLSSTNGTFINGIRLKEPTPLYPGDQISLADTHLTFQIDQGLPVLF